MLHKLVLLTLAPLALLAQSGVTFSYQISGLAGVVPLAAGGTIVYPAVSVGSASLATIYCSNQSQSAIALSASASNLLFAVSPASAQLATGATSSVAVTFTPKSAGAAAGTMSFILTTASGGSQVVRFTLSGQAVDGLLASFALSSDGNQSLIGDGGTIAFPATAPSSQASATFTISNRTSASVAIDALLLSGAGFRLSGLPLMPVTLGSGSQMSVGISFVPDQPGSFSGTLTWSAAGASHRILLSGPAATSSLAFELAGSTTQTLQTGDSIAFPSTAIGATTVLSLRLRNTGTAPAQVSTLTASPTSFVLQNPPTLPLTIAASGSTTLAVAFVPLAAGNITGALRIGDATFVLAGAGLGARFSCTVTPRGQTPFSCDANTITLPSTSIGDQLPFTVQITNSGNQSGALQNFAVGGTGFAAVVPSLPLTLAPGESVSVNAAFAPVVLGITGGYLQINGQTSNLTVAATAPPSLPAITFTNVSPQMGPLAQPLVGIHLAAAYPYDLSGRLSVSFTSDALIDDPAIQFLNGQRYVDFKIPAGAGDAVFGTTAKGVVLQTGSSAGAIALSATLSLNGGYVVTGSTPIAQNISILAAAPEIRAFQIGSMDGTGFDLVITGVSTTRSLTQLAFTLTPTEDSALTTTTLTADVSAAFTTWYNSTLSRNFGGQFSVSIRFNVAGDVAAIQSIAATATNANGTSTPKSLALQATATP